MHPEIAKILEGMKYWKKTIEGIKDFTGTSPPSVFVGRSFYPRVFVGVLAPPQHMGEAWLLDAPEQWYKQNATIGEILGYRGQLIYSRARVDVRAAKGKLVGLLQELAAARRQIDVEVQLKKAPKFRFTFNKWVQPIGNPAPILQAKLVENPSVEKKVDYLISDFDIKAEDAALELYRYRIPVSRIQKIFSAGLLGLKIQRKLVPTAWSITAVDDIIGKALREKIKTYEKIEEIRLFHNEYLGNHYEILLLPEVYQYELVELWNWKERWLGGSDYEPYWGRKDYAKATEGAFYSGRLGISEYLAKIKRQASVLVIREVRPAYIAPVGIWQMREAIRDAFSKPFEKFDSLDLAIEKINQRLLSRNLWIGRSKLLRILKEQRKLT